MSEQFLPDGEGGEIAPIRIPEIDDAAEAYRAAKKRREKLKLAEDEARVRLKDVVLKHKDEIPGKVYRYSDRHDVQMEVAMDKDPGVVVRKAKKPKSAPVRESHGINPGNEPVPELDDGNPKDAA